MNYRALHLRQQSKNQLAKLQQEWHQLENQYKGDILALQNSTDIKLLNQTQAHREKLQKALDSIIAVLGKEEIKELKDIQNLLKGKTLKGLINHYQKQLTELEESKNEELETLIIKQTELEALRKEQQKALKKEIDNQQKELISRTREIWDLEKKQEQTLKTLSATQEELKTTANQLKKETNTNTLYQQKISDLDNQLINLARQKIKNQKEAKELLNQLESNWKSDKNNWEQEKTNLITTYQQEQEQQASNLAQERKEFYEKIERLNQINQELTTNLTEKGTTITNHLTTIKELEAEITNQKTNLKNLEQKRLKEQEEAQQERKFWNQEAQVQTERYNQLEKEKNQLVKSNQSLTKQLQEQKNQTLKNKIKELKEISQSCEDCRTTNSLCQRQLQAIRETFIVCYPSSKSSKIGVAAQNVVAGWTNEQVLATLDKWMRSVAHLHGLEKRELVLKIEKMETDITELSASKSKLKEDIEEKQWHIADLKNLKKELLRKLDRMEKEHEQQLKDLEKTKNEELEEISQQLKDLEEQKMNQPSTSKKKKKKK